MKTVIFAATVLIAGIFVLSAMAQDDPPAVPKKPAARKPVYDEKADAKAQLAAALTAAKRENRRVLIQWGANWCGKCVGLDELLNTDRDLKKALLYEYVVVHVDIGMGDRNVDLYRKYEAFAVPYLMVLDPAGKVLAKQAGAFEITSKDGKEGHDAKKLLEFLNAHRAEPRQAAAVLDAALAQAAKTERGVFLHFGAPWCGWCLKLEAWLAQPKVAEIMGKDFVDVKIDLDRMTGAKEVFARYNADAKGGIPWFAMLDAKGKAVVTSDSPKGNTGFPYQPHEIDHFVAMLKMAKQRITGNELDELRRSLAPPAKGVSANK
jgi:thiol:disulfide interchange protein